jgi:hypothetical protein
MILDAQGRKILKTQSGIWGPSLPKIQQWHQWIAANGDRVRDGQPWVRFIFDATLKLQDGFHFMSRTLRAKPNWGRDGWTGEDFKPIGEDARERLAWFEQNKPRVESMPPWAEFFLDALEGSYLTQVRLADECEQALKRGFVPVRIKQNREGGTTITTEVE